MNLDKNNSSFVVPCLSLSQSKEIATRADSGRDRFEFDLERDEQRCSSVSQLVALALPSGCQASSSGRSHV